MSVLTGALKVECTDDLKKDIRNSGKAACVLLMDEIKSLDNVVDVWAPKDKRFDIIVEIDATAQSRVKELISNIEKLQGVFKIIPNISIDIK